jgi:hypothetical protein
VNKLLDENSELQRTVQENLANAEKWKGVYDTLYEQYECCQERLNFLEEENERIEAAFAEKMHTKDQGGGKNEKQLFLNAKRNMQTTK